MQTYDIIIVRQNYRKKILYNFKLNSKRIDYFHAFMKTYHIDFLFLNIQGRLQHQL